MIHAKLTVMVVLTLCTMFCTLETQREQYLSTIVHICKLIYKFCYVLQNSYLLQFDNDQF